MRNESTSRSAGSSSTTRTARRVRSMSRGNVTRCPTAVKARPAVGGRGGRIVGEREMELRLLGYSAARLLGWPKAELPSSRAAATSAAHDDQERRVRPELFRLFDRERA